MARVIRREDVIAAFGACVPLLRRIIVSARDDASAEAVAEAHPRLRAIGRTGHIHRIAGQLRWLYIAEALVAQLPGGPDGFSVLSTDQDHARGRFVFQFPGGVFTVRRQPHQDGDENVYIQECLESLLEETPLREGIDGDADLTIYINVPLDGPPQLHVSHPSLADGMTIAIDEFDAPRASMPPSATPAFPPRGVQSARRTEQPADEPGRAS